MRHLTEFVSCAALCVIAGALVYLAYVIRSFTQLVISRRLFQTVARRDTLSYRAAGTTHNGFAIYMYRQGRWYLEADLSKPGCEATPPEAEGAFEGQVVRRQSVPK